jgi:hypothetical protein
VHILVVKCEFYGVWELEIGKCARKCAPVSALVRAEVQFGHLMSMWSIRAWFCKVRSDYVSTV